jgi:four helix bundle protein
MATIKRFEDLLCWQKARELNGLIYKSSKTGPFEHDYSLRDQIRRASVSVMSNVAEGFERAGNKEFIQFLAIAKGSCGELRSQLYVALDQAYLDESDFQRLYGLSTEVSRLLSSFMTYLRGSELRGGKFKKNPSE